MFLNASGVKKKSPPIFESNALFSLADSDFLCGSSPSCHIRWLVQAGIVSSAWMMCRVHICTAVRCGHAYHTADVSTHVCVCVCVFVICMSCISASVTLETLSHQSALKEKVLIPPAGTQTTSSSVSACPSVMSHRAPIPGSVGWAWVLPWRLQADG